MDRCKRTKKSKDDYPYINYFEESLIRFKDRQDVLARYPCSIMKKIIKQDKIKGLREILFPIKY